jgi:cation:H+ antiporter
LEHVGLFVLGLALLAVGVLLLVFGAARLDLALGRSPFAVGVVAVAFGPCVAGLAFNLAVIFQPAPELYQRLALATVAGNIVGSNIASIGLVLGAAALVRPVAASAKLFHTAIPLTLAGTALFWFLARNSPLSRVDAGFLLTAAVVALVLLVRAARKEGDAGKVEFAGWVPERTRVWLAVLHAAAGLAATGGGAMLAAAKLIDAMRALKTSAPVMGETLVAFGTSLPALVAAVVSARRGRSGLVLGIVVGSVVFNLLLVAGIAAMIEPLPITSHAILNEIPVMGLFTLLLLPVLLNGLKVPRWEGVLLLAAYAAFVMWQVLRVPVGQGR